MFKCYVGVTWLASITLHGCVYFRAFHARSVIIIALLTNRQVNFSSDIDQRTLFIFILFASDRLKSFFFTLNPAPCIVPYPYE